MHNLLFTLCLVTTLSCTAAAATDNITEGSPSMNNKILVAYASKYGSTAEVAERIGKVLSDQGIYVDVIRVNDIRKVAPYYKAVVLGSAIYIGNVMGESRDFVNRNRATLTQVPVAFFVVSGQYGENPSANYEAINKSMDGWREQVKPVDTAIFGGKLDYSKMNFFDGIISRMVGAKEQDKRDWSAIEAWARSLSGKLGVGE